VDFKTTNKKGLPRMTTLIIDKKQRTANIGLAKAGLKEVIEHLYYYQHLCLISADGFQIPHHRQFVNRCLQSSYHKNS
jgi:hypothetical protein